MLPKRLLYIPGMTSLIGLSVLIGMHLKQYKDQPKRNTIATYWIDRLTYCSGGDAVYYIDTTLTYTEVTLTGDSLSDNHKLQRADSLLGNILNKTNKHQGMHYSFSNTAKYGTFFGVLNNLLKKAPHQYLLHKSGIWITGEQYSFILPLPETEQTTHSSARQWKLTPPAFKFCIAMLAIFMILNALSIRRSFRLSQ